MVGDLVGYRFSPTGEELIKYYLMNKNLGKTWLVDEAIREINICSFKPKFLPKLAKIQSDDPFWLFFCPIEFTSVKKTARKRNTGSGYWKPTGKDRKVRDKRGNGVEIGFKKSLVYYEGKVPNGARTPWVMHEYHITCLPLAQRNYVLCQVMYKGKDGVISYGNNLGEPSHSLVSDSNTVSATIDTVPELEQPSQENLFGMSVDDLMIPMNEQQDLSPSDVLDPYMFSSDNNNSTVQPQDISYGNNLSEPSQSLLVYDSNTVRAMYTVPEVEQEDHSPSDAFDPDMFFSDNNNPTVQPQAPHLDPNDDEFLDGLRHGDRGHVEYLFANEESISRPTTSMQENRNDHRPRKPLTRIIVDCSSDSDSDAESIFATSYKGTSSPGDSVGSSNRYFPRCSSTDSCKDLPTSSDPSVSRNTGEYQLIRLTIPSKQKVLPIPSKQEVKQDTSRAVDAPIDKESFMVKTEKKGWFILEEAMVMKMIIGFILLVALIGAYRFY